MWNRHQVYTLTEVAQDLERDFYTYKCLLGQEDIYLSNFEDFWCALTLAAIWKERIDGSNSLPSSQETLSSSSRTDIEEEPYLDKEENLDYISFCNGSTLDTPNISFVQQSNPITSSFAQRLSYLEGGSPPLLEPSDGEDDEDDAELETREEEITKVEGVGVKKD